MNCSKCSVANEESAKFCNSCGSPFSQISNVIPSSGDHSTPPSVKKKGGCLRAFLITLGSLVGLFILIIVIAVNSDDSTTTSSSGVVEGSKKQNAKPKEEPFNLEQFKSEAQAYPYKDLARNPNDFLNKKVVFTGKIVQVMESSGNNVIYRINVTKTKYSYDDTVYVTYTRTKNESRVLEDDIVDFWGESKGLKSYESTIGGKISIPQINAVAIELKK